MACINAVKWCQGPSGFGAKCLKCIAMAKDTPPQTVQYAPLQTVQPTSPKIVQPASPIARPMTPQASSAATATTTPTVAHRPRTPIVANDNGWSEVRNRLESCEGLPIAATLGGFITKLGKGVNKQAYRVVQRPWVILVTTAGQNESKWRGVKLEVQQLEELRKAGIRVPKLGPVEDLENVFVNVKAENGEDAIAFIEEFIEGNHDLCRQESHQYAQKFADEIYRVVAPNGRVELAKWTNAKADLEALENYLNKGSDIPDFQIVVEALTGHIVTIDPGDPSLSWALSKHQDWIKTWQKVIKLTKPRRI